MVRQSELRAKVSAQGVDQAAKDIKSVGDAMQSVGRDVRGAANDMKAGQSAWANFKKDFKQGFQFSAGMETFDLLKTGVLDFTKMAISGAADLEANLNLLQATAGATEQEMQLLRETASALGSDMSLPGTSAGDAAAAMLELNKAGLSLTDTMAAAKGVLQLSAAAQIENAEAAVLVGDALNTFGLQGTEAIRVADLLAGVSASASGSIQDAGYAMQQAGAVYAAANVPIETTATLIGLLAKNGIKGSDAGTSLKTMMQRLQSPTGDASKAMRDLNVAVYNADGSMRAMPDIIADFASGLSHLSEEQRANALNTIFGSDAVRAASILFREGADGYEAMFESVTRSGVAGDIAAAQMKGLKGSIEGLISQLETLGTNVITPLLPAMTGLVTAAATATGWLGDNMPIAIGAATFALAAYTLQVNGAAISTAGGLIPAMKAAAIAAKGAAASFAAAAAPFAVIAGLAVMLGATVYAIDQFGERLEYLKQEGLESRDSWNEATAALEEFNNASQDVRQNEAIRKEAEELERLTKLYDQKFGRATGTGSRWDSVKSFFDTDSVEAKQHEELRELEAALDAQRAKLEEVTSEQRDTTAAYADAVAMYNNLEAGASGYTAEVEISAEVLEKYNETLTEVMKAGASAFVDMTQARTSYFASESQLLDEHLIKIQNLENERSVAESEGKADRVNALNEQITSEETAYQQRRINQAIQYAHEREAQRQHLGNMLMDWIENEEAKLVASDQYTPEMETRFTKLREHTQQEYGLMGTGVEAGFGKTAAAYKDYLDGVQGSIDGLAKQTQGVEEHFAAVDARARELEREYITELVMEEGELTPEEYARRLQEIPQQARTQAELDVTAAETEAQRIQDEYNNIPNHMQSEAFLDANSAYESAATVTERINDIPDEHTTKLNVDGKPAVDGAYNTGRDINIGLANGISAHAYMVANAMQKTAATAYASAKGYLQIASPSRKFHEIGKWVDEGLALGILAHAEKPKEAAEKLGRDIVGAFEKYEESLSDVTKRYAKERLGIWMDYHQQLKEQTDKFNSNKFDDQLDFYDQIAGLTEAQRADALARQQAAWEEAQAMAQEGRSAEAQAYYEAALAEIDADIERGEKLVQISEDIADKRKEIAEETDAERKAQLEAELYELESRKQYLEEVDRLRDQRAAENLEKLRNEESAIAEERDDSLQEAQQDYRESVRDIEAEFVDSFDRVRSGIEGVGDSTTVTADEMVAAYQRITGAANDAARAASNAASGASVDGSHAKGLWYVPFDGYRAELHEGEQVLTRDEAEAWRAEQQTQQQSKVVERIPLVQTDQTEKEHGVRIEKLADQIIIQNDMDIEQIAAEIIKRVKRRSGR